MLPVSRFAANGNARMTTRTAVGERPMRVCPADRPQQQEDRAAPPGEPGDLPRQQRPGREQRQHPRRVDVGQERARRVVGVAALEPDADARPVRLGIGARRLAPGGHAGERERERDDQQAHRQRPVRLPDAGGLAAERTPDHAGTPRWAARGRGGYRGRRGRGHVRAFWRDRAVDGGGSRSAGHRASSPIHRRCHPGHIGVSNGTARLRAP